MRTVSAFALSFLSTPSARRATLPRVAPPLEAALFLSTPSARRATFQPVTGMENETFLSTPSARRATFCFAATVRQHPDFYPRPPRGGRRASALPLIPTTPFLSTPSARRATYISIAQRLYPKISIHALCEEGDDVIPLLGVSFQNFYPRPPRGGRPGISRTHV